MILSNVKSVFTRRNGPKIGMTYMFPSEEAGAGLTFPHSSSWEPGFGLEARVRIIKAVHVSPE